MPNNKLKDERRIMMLLRQYDFEIILDYGASKPPGLNTLRCLALRKFNWAGDGYLVPKLWSEQTVFA